MSGTKYSKSVQNIHTAENTNIEIILKNAERLGVKNEPNNCVLITTGSLNPVHRSHVKNLQCVKDYLETQMNPPWHVLAGYLSPTHDSYVRSKLGPLDWIKSVDRFKLCQDAIESEGEQISSWLSVARGEIEYDKGFVDFDEVCLSLYEFLKSIFKYPLRVVYVCGLDHFNKCPHVQSLAGENGTACAVVYRLGQDENRILRSVKSSQIIYVPLTDDRDKLIDVSSTQIRRLYQTSTHNENDDNDFVYANVRKFMNEKYARQRGDEKYASGSS